MVSKLGETLSTPPQHTIISGHNFSFTNFKVFFRPPIPDECNFRNKEEGILLMADQKPRMQIELQVLNFFIAYYFRAGGNPPASLQVADRRKPRVYDWR